MQFELSTTYHLVSIHNFARPLDLCRLNGILFPDSYKRTLERLHEAVMYLTKPTGYLPATNDSDARIESIPEQTSWADGRFDLREGAERFGREDMLYVASDGREGEPPSKRSLAFPHAGFYVMSSGWDRDSLYLVFDAGPFGAAHQHEDKLSFECCAYGETLLFDTGRFSYAHPVFRPYVCSSFAHDTAIVDGHGQARGLQPPEDRKWVVSEPLDNPWVSQADFDYAEGAYDEGYGPQRDRGVTHRRKVLFVKNAYWVIVDRFEGSGEHAIDTLFHFAPGSVDVCGLTLACASRNEGRPNVLVSPSRIDGLTVSTVEGSESPCQGWISTEYNKWFAAPVADYAYTGPLPVEIAYLILPVPAAKAVQGSIAPVELSVDGSSPGAAASAFVIELDDGRTDHILLARGVKGEKTFSGISTDAEIAVVRRHVERYRSE
jgi:hypothetical protein